MKAPNLSKWEKKPNLEGILFFAQLIIEMLFDYTIDSYKIPALNSRTLTLELLESIKDFESNFLRQGAIKQIVMELVDRLNKDPSIREILKDYFIEFTATFRREQPIPDLKGKVFFLHNKINDNYFDTTVSLLRNSISDSKKKEKITRVAKNYVIELLSKGYSSQYIYFETERFFFEGRFPSKIDSASIIEDYFSLFSSEIKTFDVIYRAGKIFNAIREYSLNLGIKIQENPPVLEFLGQSQKIDSFLSQNVQLPLFLTLNNIQSFDEFKAREFADQKLYLIDSLAKYHIHRGELNKSNDALVYSVDQKRFGIYKRPNPAVMKRPDRAVEKLSSLVKNTISNITSKKLEDESFQRMLRALLRHNSAIRSEAPENQLLEFWSAVEVLFPPASGEADRISQISASMVSFISSEYAAKMASDLFMAIRNSNCREAIEVLNQIKEGNNFIEKCLALISIETNLSFRERLYELFEWHPLLRNRIYYLNSRFYSASQVLNTLNSHMERVVWQIGRIYRARNLFIHSGKTLPYVSILVENLHSYLDRVMDILNEKIYRSSHSTSIDQIVIEVKLEADAHLRKLKNLGNAPCTSENYKLILFGN